MSISVRGNARRSKQRTRQAAQPAACAGGSSLLKVPFQPLTSSEVTAIHRAALEVLETVGMAGATPQVIDIAVKCGCTLNADNRLCFPAALVEDTIAVAAKRFTVHARDPAFDFEASNGAINLCTGGAAVSVYEHEHNSYRPSVLNDLYDLARVADTLEHLQWFARPVVATDIEDPFTLDVNTVLACAAGTRKHIATSLCSGASVLKMEALFDALAGGQGRFRQRPFCTVHATTVVSPLSFAADSLDVACEAVKMGMPIHSQTGPQAGATGPAALAGTLVQCCAEGLASLCVINMLHPGHPVVIGNWAFVSDLRTGAFSGGGPEQALLGAASGQMSAYYGIPGGMGAAMTDSKVPDIQAGFEKAQTLLLAALSGGGFVFESAGMLASLLGCSPQALVADNEMLGAVRRIGRGIEVTDETLSVDVIKATVAGAGHYLGSPQTMSLMETEFDYPQLADRQSPQDWIAGGAATLWDRACEKAQQTLDNHRPYYIDTRTDRWLRDHYSVRLDINETQP